MFGLRLRHLYLGASVCIAPFTDIERAAPVFLHLPFFFI